MSNNSIEKQAKLSDQSQVAESTQKELKDFPIAKLLERLQTSLDGLGKAEAQNRLEK